MRDALRYPVPLSERISIIYLERTSIEREGHALVALSGSSRILLPIGKTAVLMLGPGSTVSHAAVSLCSLEGAMLLWVGEGGVRLYAASNSRGRPEAILHQATLRLAPESRLLIARRMYSKMFEEEPPQRRSIDQLRGLEGAKVKAYLHTLACTRGMTWSGRTHDLADPLNLGISTATAALYGLCEAIVLALGFSPSIGFVHSGDPRSFVFDVADIIKFKTVVPLAFDIVAESSTGVERRVRAACRDMFMRLKLADQLVEIIEDLMYADAVDRPAGSSVNSGRGVGASTN